VRASYRIVISRPFALLVTCLKIGDFAYAIDMDWIRGGDQQRDGKAEELEETNETRKG
jgi:hypothetical protein